MDTTFTHAFSALENPFKWKLFLANMIYKVLCVLSILLFGVIAFYNYTFLPIFIFFIAVVCGYGFYIINLNPQLINMKTPSGYLQKHQEVLDSSSRAKFLMSVIEFYAAKMDIDKPFKLSLILGNGDLYVGINSTKTDNIFIFSQQILHLKNSEIYAIVGHELSHIAHDDIKSGYQLHKWFANSLILLGCHFIILNPQYITFLSFILTILMFLIYIIILTLLKLYISRCHEYLADIGSVKVTGQGRALIDVLKVTHEINQRSPIYEVFRKTHQLGLSTHPEYDKRKSVILKAQAVYEKINKPTG